MKTTIRKIYSNIYQSECFVFVGREIMDRIASVKHVRKDEIFGNQIVVEHKTSGTYTVKQEDRGFFFVEGPHYSGDANGFADAVRLLNSL